MCLAARRFAPPSGLGTSRFALQHEAAVRAAMLAHRHGVKMAADSSLKESSHLKEAPVSTRLDAALSDLTLVEVYAALKVQAAAKGHLTRKGFYKQQAVAGNSTVGSAPAPSVVPLPASHELPPASKPTLRPLSTKGAEVARNPVFV